MRVVSAVLVILFIVLLWYNNLIGLLLVVPAVLLITATSVRGGDDRTVHSFAKMGVTFVDPVAMNCNNDKFFKWAKNNDNPNLTAGFINNTSYYTNLFHSLMESIIGAGFKIYSKRICLNADFKFDPKGSTCLKQDEIDKIKEGVIRFGIPGHAMSIVIKDRVINIYEPIAMKDLDIKIRASFKKIFAKQLSKGYIIKTLVDDIGLVKFQGLGGSKLCQCYAIYIAALKILNPTVEFSVIEKYLNRDKGTMQLNILRFMYYIYEKIIRKLRDKITNDMYSPFYVNYVQGLYYPGLDIKDTLEYANVKCVLDLYKVPYDISVITNGSFDIIEYLNLYFKQVIRAGKSNKAAIFNPFIEEKVVSKKLLTDPDLDLPLSILKGQIYHTRKDLSAVRKPIYDINLQRNKIKIINDTAKKIKDDPDKLANFDQLALDKNTANEKIKGYELTIKKKLYE